MKRRSSRLAGFVLAGLLAATTGVIVAQPASAACGGVAAPRVRYWCDATSPNVAYTNFVLGVKHYNEFYVGSAYPIGIYAETSNGTWLANATVNGTSFVYKTFPGATVRAVCWNRSSVVISGTCDYIYGY